jgi:NAD(P)-dependent dehydrogenase (short-subunit alcohol dehydrogenase family)
MLITGASAHQGRHGAPRRRLAGYSVCVNYAHNHDAAQALTNEIVAGGGTSLALAPDVSVETEVVRLFETVDRARPLRALVNNAGVVERQTRVEHAGRRAALAAVRDQRDRQLSLRARGGAPHVDPPWRQWGAIVNVSSAASRLGSPGEYVDYAASKGAIDTFTIGLARKSPRKASA